VKGYYEKPDSYNDSDTILWDANEGTEWLEITIKGKVQNLNLVTLKQNTTQDKLISDEILYHLDSVENQTVLVKTIQVEGIPREAIMFEDEKGNPYYYYIEEKSLAGGAYSSNQQVFSIGAR